MERVTQYLDDGTPTIRRRYYCDSNFMTTPADIEAVRRLAAYEDTSLTPEEIIDLAAKRKVSDILSADLERGLDKLMEYQQAEADGRLVILNLAPQEAHDGLKRKYIVFKSDTGEPVENCFVLRPDRDRAARDALRAYIVSTENLELAMDLDAWLKSLEVYT